MAGGRESKCGRYMIDKRNYAGGGRNTGGSISYARRSQGGWRISVQGIVQVIGEVGMRWRLTADRVAGAMLSALSKTRA